MSDRTKLLHALISLDGKPAEVATELAKFPWDSTEALAKFEPTDLERALTRFIEGGIAESDLTDWANAIESRDDIEFASAMSDYVSELANPDTMGHLTVERAKEILNELNQRS